MFTPAKRLTSAPISTAEVAATSERLSLAVEANADEFIFLDILRQKKSKALLMQKKLVRRAR